jgi:hypothetical protein
MKSARLPKVIDLLQRTACTAPELAAKVYCTERSAQQMINRLRLAGTVHIQEWRRSGRVLVAVYRYGIGTDAVKPPPLTAAESVCVDSGSERHWTIRLSAWQGKEARG